jgi:hypothetical protein
VNTARFDQMRVDAPRLWVQNNENGISKKEGRKRCVGAARCTGRAKGREEGR